MASIAPLSVQFSDRIVLDKIERKSSGTKEIRDASKILQKMDEAAALQDALGLGNPVEAVKAHKTDMAKYKNMAQAEALAEKFPAVREPSEKFFPRFALESGMSRIGNMASGSAKGRLPELVMVKLGKGISKVYCRMINPAKDVKSAYEANIPVIPLTVLELAKRAKALANDAEFHLLFMPSWEPAPQRDPVLIAHIPGTNDFFEIASWDGDADLIKEFLEDA